MFKTIESSVNNGYKGVDAAVKTVVVTIVLAPLALATGTITTATLFTIVRLLPAVATLPVIGAAWPITASAVNAITAVLYKNKKPIDKNADQDPNDIPSTAIDNQAKLIT